MTLFLINHHHTNLDLCFPWAQGPRKPYTMLMIPSNKRIDLSLYFPELSSREIRSIVEASPEYQRLHKSKIIEIYDTEDNTFAPAPVANALGSLHIIPEAVPASPPIITGDSSPAPVLPKIVPYPEEHGVTPAMAMQKIREEEAAEQAYILAKNTIKDVVFTAVNTTESTVSAEPPVKLDISLKEAINESTPSSRMTLEQLQKIAKQRGIIVDNLSKAAVLRKLRGV